RCGAAGRAAGAAPEPGLGIGGLRRQPAALAAGGRLPVGARDALARAAVPDAHGAVVLLRAEDAVWRRAVGGHAVELRGRLVLQRRPIRAAVGRNVRAAVVAFDHAPRVRGVDPQVVVVAVPGAHARERLAAVARAVQRDVEHPHGVGVLRIGFAARVVPGALAQLAILVLAGPRRAAVVA